MCSTSVPDRPPCARPTIDGGWRTTCRKDPSLAIDVNPIAFSRLMLRTSFWEVSCGQLWQACCEWAGNSRKQETIQVRTVVKYMTKSIRAYFLQVFRYVLLIGRCLAVHIARYKIGWLFERVQFRRFFWRRRHLLQYPSHIFRSRCVHEICIAFFTCNRAVSKLVEGTCFRSFHTVIVHVVFRSIRMQCCIHYCNCVD